MSSFKKDLYEVALVIPASEPAAPALERLKKLSINPEKTVCAQTSGINRHCFYTPSRKKVLHIERLFSKHFRKPLRLEVRFLRTHDWFDKWKRDYHIGRLGCKFEIVPEWERSKHKPSKRIPIFLDPAGAFGSGEHETTRLMVRMLEACSGRFESFLDVGTGSGILSIAASKLGAKQILGLDVDLASVRAARNNLKSNGCEEFRVLHKKLETLKIRKPFDLVGANLFTDVLIREKRRLLSRVKPGGFLALSGILNQHFDELRQVYRSPKLRRVAFHRSRKWTGVLFQRKN